MTSIVIYLEMPVNKKFLEPFEEDSFYHVYCKSVGNDLLFKSDNNRLFFLKQYQNYISCYADTYCYNLLDNHVHWLIKTKKTTDLIKHLKLLPKEKLKDHQKKFIGNTISFDSALEYQFKDFFISYAKAFNEMYKRSGSLFINPFRRIKIKNDFHFTQLVIYIHANACKHGLIKNFELYKWSSFKSFLSGSPTSLKRNEVLEWFGGVNQFIKAHREQVNFYYDHPLAIEI